MEKIIKDLSIEDYHYNEPYKSYISATSLKKAKGSLKEFKHYQDNAASQERKAHFDFGNAVELALLDKEEFARKVAVFHDDAYMQSIAAERPELKSIRSCKQYKDIKSEFEAKATAANMYIINDVGDHSLENIAAIVKSCNENDTITRLLEMTEYQTSLFWTCPKTGLKLKTRPDAAIVNKNNLIDIKTIGNGGVSPRNAAKQVANLNYPMQAVMQIDGCIQTGYMDKVDNYFWLFLDSNAPFDAVLYEFPKEARELKMADYHRTLQKVERAKSTGEFPGYSADANNKYGILEMEIW